jgi:hypothetical protein
MSKNSLNDRAPVSSAAFVPLSLGSVKPRTWLRNQRVTEFPEVAR